MNGNCGSRGVNARARKSIGIHAACCLFIPLCFLVEEQKGSTSYLCCIAQFILWFCL